jgi:hypothetical protein
VVFFAGQPGQAQQAAMGHLVQLLIGRLAGSGINLAVIAG